jgi:hypothetical protein
MGCEDGSGWNWLRAVSSGSGISGAEPSGSATRVS